MKLSVLISALLFTTMLLAAESRVLKTSHGDVQLFPTDYPLNQPITDAPIHDNSEAYIRSIGEAKPIRPGFGHRDEDGSPMGFRIFTIPADQKKLKVSFEVNDPAMQDMIDYPIPDEAATLTGSFRNHRIILDPANKKLYEFYAVHKEQEAWKITHGSCFDLTSAKPLQAGKKGAVSSGLPVLAGLVTVDEVKAGKIQHALLFTVSKTQKGRISPASGIASADTNQDLPPMGLRLRLRNDFDAKWWPKNSQAIVQALKTYGMLVVDNGVNMELWGESSPSWNQSEIDKLRNIKAADFDVVDTGPIVNQ